MNTLNHSKSHVISQPEFACVVPMQSGAKFLRISVKRVLIAGSLAAAAALPAWAGADTDGAVAPDSAALHQWRAIMAQMPTPAEGCFHASYPSTVPEKVECSTDHQPGVHPSHRKLSDDAPDVVGNGDDYVAEATGLLTGAQGFFATKDVTSETGVGGSGGILGPNEYSVQLNTNMRETTDACQGHSGCTVWQQFVYSPDYIQPGTAAVFMQYWLINWGDSACPNGWSREDSDCFKNSLLEPAKDLPIKDLGDFELTASATAGGSDKVEFYYGSDYWWVKERDSVLDISSVWNKVEFNVVGNAGGSQANFNSGASISPLIRLNDGSTAAPKCLANAGTTGETNNLNLVSGSCLVSAGDSAYGVTAPYMEYTESN
jgi:hypothetical protein